MLVMRKFLPVVVGLAVLAVLLLPVVVFAGDAKPTYDGELIKDDVDFCAGDQQCGNFFTKYINPAILVLSGLVGVAAVISIVVAGIQYASSADDSGVVTKAKQRVFNTVVGLVAYIFLIAFLSYLVPGGLL